MHDGSCDALVSSPRLVHQRSLPKAASAAQSQPLVYVSMLPARPADHPR